LEERIVLRATATLEIWWCPDDFETNEEWKRFVERLKKDREFAKRFFVDTLHHEGVEDYINWDEVIESLEVIHER